jgi:predicted RNase H-like HicB family nuclease
MKEYAVIFEKTSTDWSAYVPDLPGLGVAGPAYEAAEPQTREGLLAAARMPISASFKI